MERKTEPWYIHAGLWAVIVILVVILIQVSIIEPTNVIREETYFKNESRLRMENIKQAEILYEDKHSKFSDNLDTLINFIKTDSSVIALVEGIDTLTQKSTNPFVNLTDGVFTPESLYTSPRSGSFFIVQTDTLLEIDTVINRRGKIVKIDSTTTIGTRYVIENPDSEDKIGDLYSDALRNTASWE
ncbi:MAG: hypothetical protein ABFS12_17840 [Bacteroidota bacterium]